MSQLPGAGELSSREREGVGGRGGGREIGVERVREGGERVREGDRGRKGKGGRREGEGGR